MSVLERMRDRLPSLYRPEDGDDGLLGRYLEAVAGILEEIGAEAGEVLQAHWVRYADRAHFHPFIVRSREVRGEPPPNPLALEDHPWVRDLARLAALLPLPAWREPASLRETVEAYRQRIGRYVALYRNGLGTIGALRRMIEAQLPPELGLPPAEQDRPFELEEFAPIVRRSLAVTARGEPTDMVGPLMRWTVANDGLEAVSLTVYVQGVEPVAGAVDATATPVIELLDGGDGRPPLGIAYDGLLAAGETLRLRPVYSSWLGLANGLHRARSRADETTGADPTAPGPWRRVDEAPGSAVVAVRQTHDRALWVAAVDGDEGTLWRFDGRAWTAALSDLPALHCLAEDRRDLLVGTAGGLLRVPLYPESPGAFAASSVPGLDGCAVHALLAAGGDRWWVGTSAGLALVDTDGQARPQGLRADQDTGVAVYALARDQTGTLFLGTELGCFQFEEAGGAWYWYAGGTVTEQESEWREFALTAAGDPAALPEETEVFLPPVRAIYPGPDASLWLGTDAGIARYLARSVRGLTYETVLEAFPDLAQGPVLAIAEDARGRVWFATERGVVRYDGRDWWQPRGEGWRALGAASLLFTERAEPRGTWRFDRGSSRWQRWEAEGWREFAGGLRTTAREPVRALAWVDEVEAHRGAWDGTTFTVDAGVRGDRLRMRVKPRPDVIIDGGIPAVPRLPAGASQWRYLTLEPPDVAEPDDRPAWTIEGRLLPPPEAAAPWPGRYDLIAPPPASHFDQSVFAFAPAARVWLTWKARRPLTVLARLRRRREGEVIDPAIVERVWQGIQQVRPAGVRVALAVEEAIVRGEEHGSPGG